MTNNGKMRIKAFAVIAVCLACLVFLSPSAVQAEESQVLEHMSVSKIHDRLSGEVFQAPKKTYISYGGTNYEANYILRDSHNDGFRGDSILLQEAGKYTINYTATASDGRLLSASQYFIVVKPLYEATGKFSAQYSENPKGYGAAPGILTDLMAGDSFIYNEVINLSNSTKDDVFLKFYSAPKEIYSYDASHVVIKLTDVHDPSNYVTLRLKRVQMGSVGQNANSDHFSYVTAHAGDYQLPTGIELKAAGPSKYRGENCIIHVNGEYGTTVRFSLSGGHAPQNNRNNYLGKEMRLSYDAAERAFYAFSQGAVTPLRIADLDDPVLFDKLWSGFDSGDVLLSVSFDKYVNLSAAIVITDIAGQSLTAHTAPDTTAPSIHVDLPATGVPIAKKGMAYKLFDASAYDGRDGQRNVIKEVWYNYATPKTRVLIPHNGDSFVPEFSGNYTVVYTATDLAGNTSQEKIVVISADIPLLSLSLGNEQTSAMIQGQQYKVKALLTTGGSGNKSTTIEARLTGSNEIRYSIDLDKLTFIPLQMGEYEIVYTSTDYLSTTQISYKVNAGQATKAYLNEGANLPKYFISGAYYRIADLYGYVFSGSQPQLKKAEIKYSFDNGAARVYEGGLLKIDATTSVAFTYTLSGDGIESESKEYSVNVIHGAGTGESGALKMDKYFINSTDDYVVPEQIRTNASVLMSNSGVQITATNNSDSKEGYSVVDFINPLLARSFTLNFRASLKNFQKLDLILADSLDSSQSIKVTMKNGGSKAFFSVNDGIEYELMDDGRFFELIYNEEKKVITPVYGTNINVTKTREGKNFKGFESGKVYLTMCINGIAVNKGTPMSAGIIIQKVNNQAISDDGSDFIPPEVSFGAPGGDRKINTTELIKAVVAADVLDPTVSVVMTMYAPDGTIAKSADGILLDNSSNPYMDHRVLLSQFGTYIVKYSVKEESTGRTRDYEYPLRVMDMEPPQVVINNPQTKGNLGEKIKLAGLTFTDNTAAVGKITVTVFVQAPTGKVFRLGQTDVGFVPEHTGKYRVIYYLTDEGNIYNSVSVPNVAIVDYYITVSDKG